ncbi:MAG: ribose-phosphate diphosphokinase [Candidatus Thermoplasmatota archaeon]|nr:ribose-phosphate diphosphokinase [Candidatus Thermoplasmatota archaeon]
MKIVHGSSSKGLAEKLAKETNVDLSEVILKRFPDRECYVRIMDDLDNENVVLIQNAYPDENIVEFFLLADAIREFKVKKLTAVIPYFGYARQDKKFNPGEPISVRALIKRLQIGIDKIITVDIHDENVLKWFDIPNINVSGMPAIGEYLKKLNPDIVIAPDDGALQKAKNVADIVGCSYDYLDKKRIDAEHVEMKTKNIDVKNKNVAIVDDIISTGGTIITAAKNLKKQGAKSVYACCTHGLFAGNSLPKLQSVCDKIVSTDTIENPASIVSVASEIEKIIK